MRRHEALERSCREAAELAERDAAALAEAEASRTVTTQEQEEQASEQMISTAPLTGRDLHGRYRDTHIWLAHAGGGLLPPQERCNVQRGEHSAGWPGHMS